ncbi:MAG: Holliday junction branch migration DNA helicase RuvB [Candidatus Pacebacteria bacterium]|nr:Holliday junction branch migration DNA helicase RuvB [Candidatus Paceibacterota bacterium]
MTLLKRAKIKEDLSLDSTLRPGSWNEYVGQENIKRNLKILSGAAKERGEPLEHLLFYGPAGLGKTTLAHIIAKEMSSPIKITSGPALEKVGDLASVLTNLSSNDILFIDEAHRLNKMIEEVLYPAMESRSLNIIIGKGPSARTLQLDLPPFTLLAATTRVSLLSSPLRSRFSGGTFKLEFYTVPEIERIIGRSAEILGIRAEKEALLKIAECSRCTPRVANRLLKRCRDYAQVNKKVFLDIKTTEEALGLLEIDKAGLEQADRSILLTIINKFNGGPVGLQALAAAASEETATIEEVYEPYLMQLGFIERTRTGRMATKRAYEHLGLPFPRQDTLL